MSLVAITNGHLLICNWLIIKVLKKAKLDKQQKILLSLRFILRHIVLIYMIVVVCVPE